MLEQCDVPTSHHPTTTNQKQDSSCLMLMNTFFNTNSQAPIQSGPSCLGLELRPWLLLLERCGKAVSHLCGVFGVRPLKPSMVPCQGNGGPGSPPADICGSCIGGRSSLRLNLGESARKLLCAKHSSVNMLEKMYSKVVSRWQNLITLSGNASFV